MHESGSTAVQNGKAVRDCVHIKGFYNIFVEYKTISICTGKYFGVCFSSFPCARHQRRSDLL